MKYTLQTTHLVLSAADRQLLGRKLGRLEKRLDQPFTMSVRFRHDTHHATGNVVTCTINVKHGKHGFHAERIAASIQDALDETITALTKELSKHRDQQHRWQRS